MPAATHKTILFTRAKAGAKMAQWPTAVFTSVGQAKVFARILKVAYNAGAAEDVKRLDPAVVLGEAGELPQGPKFALVTVPYNPEPEMSDDDIVDETKG